MEFHQIRYFLMAADHLNFTRAAEQCHVSQPALTRAIQKIEDELGGELFVRDGRAITLSPLGRLMREHLQQIDEHRRMARAAAQNFIDKGTSELNVGVMCTIGPDLLSAFLSDFRETNTDILLILHDVTPEALPELVRSGALDCGFVTERRDRDSNGLSAARLFSEDLVVAFSSGHRFSNMDQVTLFDVGEENYIDRLKCEFRQPFFDFMSDNNLDFKVICSSQREDWIQELVMRGAGVSCMPRFSIMSRRLQWTNLSGPLSEPRNVTVTWSDRNPLKPYTSAFIENAQRFSWDAALHSLNETLN
jgi:DNA-binding transcriptional LysR family regulator